MGFLNHASLHGLQPVRFPVPTYRAGGKGPEFPNLDYVHVCITHEYVGDTVVIEMLNISKYETEVVGARWLSPVHTRIADHIIHKV